MLNTLEGVVSTGSAPPRSAGSELQIEAKEVHEQRAREGSASGWDHVTAEALLLEVRKLGLSIQRDCRDEIRNAGRQLADDVRLEFKMMMQELPRSLAFPSHTEGSHRPVGHYSPSPSPSFTLPSPAPALAPHSEPTVPVVAAAPVSATAPVEEPAAPTPAMEPPLPPGTPPPPLPKALASGVNRQPLPELKAVPGAKAGVPPLAPAPATEAAAASIPPALRLLEEASERLATEGQADDADSSKHSSKEPHDVIVMPHQIENSADEAAGGVPKTRSVALASGAAEVIGKPGNAGASDDDDDEDEHYSSDSDATPRTPKNPGHQGILDKAKSMAAALSWGEKGSSCSQETPSMQGRRSQTSPALCRDVNTGWRRLSHISARSEAVSEMGGPSSGDLMYSPSFTPTEVGKGNLKKMRLSISREMAKAAANRSKRKGISLRRSITGTRGPEDFVKSQTFDNIVSSVILLNAVVLGAQTDYNARNHSGAVPAHFFVFEQIFLVLFTTELVLRLAIFRCKFFLPFKEGWLWNYFDTFVVGAQLIETFFELVARSSNIDMDKFRLLRVMRILRLLRILRVVRVLHLISELRTILSSIAGSIKSLIWVVLLLFLMIYIVACYFTQTFADHMVFRREDPSFTHENEHELKLMLYFGSLTRSVLSLWQSMSGGVDWNDLVHPLLEEVSLVSGCLFSAFIAFAILALMNVVTGVFVQNALNSAKQEEDHFMTGRILELFHFADREEGASITIEEISRSLSDPKTAREWKAIGVEAEDARHLFKLFDMEDLGRVPFDEFLGGCLRLGGSAKAIDVLTIMQENRKYQEKIHIFQEETVAALDALALTMRRLHILGSPREEETSEPDEDVTLP